MTDCLFQRDCIKAPFSEKCFFYCTEGILRKAKPEQKRNILKLSTTTSEAIFSVYQNFAISNFEELASHLIPAQIAEIIKVFRSITQEQLDRFI